MALQHLRSSTANKRPDPAAMAEGQLALNTANASPGLFYKDATGSLIKAGPVHIGATAPNASPAVGGHAGNSVGEAWLDTSGTNPLLKIWNGSVFQTVQPVASGTVVSTADTGTVTSTMILDGTILNADINASAAIVDTKLATIATAGKVSNSATTATNANTASAIVARDASGNFTAGTITAALTGAASSNVLKAGDTMTGALVVPVASAATPSLTFTGDLNTGVFSPGADQVAISTNGAQRLTVDTAATTSTLPVVHPLGAVGTPSITFTGDLNTGIYSPAADTIAFVEGGAEAMRITSDGRLGLGTSSPATTLDVNGTVTCGTVGGVSISLANGSAIRNSASAANAIYFDTSFGSATHGSFEFRSSNAGTTRMIIDSAGRVGIGTTSPATTLDVNGVIYTRGRGSTFGVLFDDWRIYNSTAPGALVFDNGSERARINSSGRLLIGTSSTDTSYYDSGTFTPQIQLKGADASTSGMSLTRTDGSGSAIWLQAGSSGNNVASGNFLGGLIFSGYDGANYRNGARIEAYVDATPGSGDMPGRLVFSTTPDGSATPAERLRITSAGVLQVADAGNITVGTTTGTKIGTATTQKLGFYNATPVVQPAAVADATTAIDVITQLNDLLAKLRTLGIIAT
jgi:hypothetical protein